MIRHSLDNVMNVGEELFRTQGFYNTGTEEILELANFPRSSFYYHFKNKEGFAVAVLNRYGKNAVQFYANILTDPNITSPKGRLVKFFKLFGDLTEKRDYKSQCLIQKLAGECAGSNDTLIKVADKELTHLLKVVERCVKEGQELGEFRTDLKPKEIAQFLHGQLYGANTIARLAKNKSVMTKGLKMALEFILI